MLPNTNRYLLVLIMRTKFYSWYIYHDSETDIGKSISSAEYVEDVNSDSVVIVDGLTKVLLYSLTPERLQLLFKQNWRLPGWRICWVIGPKNLITALSQSGMLFNVTAITRVKQINYVHRIFLRWRCQSPVSIQPPSEKNHLVRRYW